MMSVLEYASDVGKSVESIFELCRKLNIKVDNEDDMLSDDDIILLDNEIDNTLSEDDSEEEMTDEEIEHCFDPKPMLRNVDLIFSRFGL